MLILDGVMKHFKILSYSLLVLLLIQCDDDDAIYSPKPKGYMHQLFPEKSYTKYDSNCPYIFEFPKYSLLVYDNSASSQSCWLDIVFPKQKAVLYISYKPIKDKADIQQYIEENRTYTIKHQVKASAIKDRIIDKKNEKVFGQLFYVSGNAASVCQFYLTDSTKHFVRASLYFNCKPNEDSLRPSIEFIEKDIEHLIESFHWK
jgi:gliding motility-associated lipoprotein GldD